MATPVDHTERSPLLSRAKASRATPQECHTITRSTRYCILGALWVGTFLSNLNLTMVATLLPSITSEFKGSNQASWIGTAYLLSSCSFTPLYGRLCTILGRKVACQIALLATGLGILLCALSGDMITLTVARFIAGIGAGALQLLAIIVSADLYNAQERGLPQALTNFFLSAGLGLGGPIGGILNDQFGWRSAFWFQVPLFVLVMIIVTNTLNYATPGQSRGAREVLSRIDFGGLITLFMMLGSTLTWLSTKFNEDLPWSDLRVITPLMFSFLSLGLHCVFECYVSSEPILPPSLFTEKVPYLVCWSNFFLGLSNFCIMYFIPLWFETVSLDSASIAGLHLLPHSLAMGLGSLVAGWFLHRTGKYTILNLVFGALPLIGLFPLVFLRENSGFIQKWFSVFPIGFGNSVIFVTVIIALQAHIPESSIAHLVAGTALFRGLGQISSVAVASAVFQSRLDTELRERIRGPDAEKIIQAIRHSLDLVKSLPPDLQRAARDAYAVSLRTVFIVSLCAMILSYIARLPIPEAPLEKQRGYVDRRDVESESGSNANGRGPESE